MARDGLPTIRQCSPMFISLGESSPFFVEYVERALQRLVEIGSGCSMPPRQNRVSLTSSE